jgi:ligand-binding sensor domain-containing protein
VAIAAAKAKEEAAGHVLPETLAGWPVTAGRVYRDGFYLATFGGGLHREDGTAVAGTPADIRDLAEVAGLLVMGHAGGLALFDGTVVRNVHLAGPPADNVSSLVRGAGYLWAGYFDGGLARMKDGIWEKVPTPGPPGAAWVNSLCWDGEALWVGSEAGLGRWTPDARCVYPVEWLEEPVQSVRCDGGVLVVAGPRYVAVHRDGDWTRHDLPYDYLHAALLVGDDFWAGGMGGLLRLRGERWKRFSQLNGALPDSWVTAVLPVGETLWVGTYDAGLVALTAEGKARMLHSDAWVNPNALAGTNGLVAMGTMEDGLHLYDRASGAWRRLSREDGLPSNDVTAILSDGDTLWVGTRGGVAELRPARPQAVARKEHRHGSAGPRAGARSGRR